MRILKSLAAPVGTSRVPATNTAGVNDRAKTVVIQSNPTNTGKIFVGDADVTASTGLIITAGTSMTLDVTDTSALYLISDTASQDVRVAILG